MLQYEIPQVKVIFFITREPLANKIVNEPAQIDDNLSLGDTPGFTEGVEDW